MVGKQPIDFFKLFFSDNVKKLIHLETTRYAEQQLAASEEYLQEHRHARGHSWTKNPMTIEEVDPLLAVLILMGLVNYPTIRYTQITYKHIENKLNVPGQISLEHKVPF